MDIELNYQTPVKFHKNQLDTDKQGHETALEFRIFQTGIANRMFNDGATSLPYGRRVTFKRLMRTGIIVQKVSMKSAP